LIKNIAQSVAKGVVLTPEHESAAAVTAPGRNFDLWPKVWCHGCSGVDGHFLTAVGASKCRKALLFNALGADVMFCAAAAA